MRLGVTERCAVSVALPEGLDRTAQIEARRPVERWIRHGSLGVLLGLVVLALLDTFGQRPTTSTAGNAAGRLHVYAPVRARSGLVYAARFRIDALHELRHATLTLAPGWAEQYTVNGLAPQPVTEGSDNGRLVFGFGHIPRGKHILFYLSLQVNPTNIGRHDQDVVLSDGDSVLATIRRTITIFP
jgi:hypothetical protein